VKLGEIKNVTSKIEQGAWVKDLPNLPGVAVRVRGYGNSDYRRKLAKLRPQMLSDDPAEQEALDARLMAETILVDWDGIDDTPYSPETAKTLLADPDLAAFRMGVNYAASVVAREGQQTLEADAKN
jgi:hypothetical protein